MAESAREAARAARNALHRQLVFEGAERAFAEKGVEDTKMEEIAAEAGVALGTLYNVFAGKAQLVAAIHETRLREAMNRTDELARSTSDPVETLLMGVRGYVEFFAGHPDYLRMHLRDGYAWGLGGRAHTATMHERARRDGHAAQAAVFERGIAQGVFYEGDPKLMARTLVAIQQVMLAEWVERDMRDDPEVLIDAMQTQARRAFCPPER